MFIRDSLETLGKCLLLMYRVFGKPDKWKMYFRQLLLEMETLGLSSLGIVIIISIFMGAIMVIQIKLDMDNPLLPVYTVGLATRDVLLLEFSSTIMCLILAGKVGSNIASEIGTMRITEQIDALEIMGVNSANFLILPKVSAFIIMMPMLVIISMAMGMIGGYSVALFSGIVTVTEFEIGLQFSFVPYHVFYSIFKSLVFAFIISSVASYYGYNVKGGALDVAKASTTAVVNSSIIILLSNIVITNFMLA